MTDRFVRTASCITSLCIAAGIGGCQRDARLADKKLRDVQVRTVEHYGVSLDEAASPQQVAYVLLRAIRDDVLAGDKKEREAALDRQFDVCAPLLIYPRETTAISREEALYRMVSHWAPAVAYYAHDLPTDWESARQRLVQLRTVVRKLSESQSAETSQVAIELADPDGDPNARVVLLVGQVKDQGYWRVHTVAFAPQRSVASRSAASAPAAEAAAPSDAGQR